MAAAIRELLLDAERRLNMSRFARARFREVLAWENSEEHLMQTYHNLLDSKAELKAKAELA
jgi:glycosyltransferase involved in cell wall biosynthesis